MKLVVKTVSGSSFDVEVDAGAKIGEVKAKIEEAQGEAFKKDLLMIIHKGQVLKDDAVSLAEAEVTENSFVVVMVSKPKPKPAAKPEDGGQSSAQAPPPPAPAPAQAPQQPPTQQQPSQPAAETPAADPNAMDAEPTPPQERGSTEAEGEQNEYGSAASKFATGPALQQSINQICEMGFPRDQVERAMRAAFNNPDRAVEYLMNGIPETEQRAPAPAPAPGAPAAAGAGGGAGQQPGQAQPQGPNTTPLDMFGGGGAAAAAGAGGGRGGGAQTAGAPGQHGPLDFLRNSPQFQALRRMVAQNPQILEPMLQELSKNNPELLRQINENQQDFLRLLTDEPPQVAEAAEGLMQLAEQGAGNPDIPELEVSPEDEEAIARLEALGFDRALCIEAYFICDKNEEFAANYLLEHGEDL